MNDNEDLYKSEQSGSQGFISLIIRGSLDRSQLGPLQNQIVTPSKSVTIFIGASLVPGFG